MSPVSNLSWLIAIVPFCLSAAQQPGQLEVPSAPVASPAVPAPGAMRLMMSEAEQLALKNNPQVAEAQFRARAYDEIKREFQSAYYPTLQANITAVGADSGTRLAAGGLNNPVVYDRVGTGVTVAQLVTDFGRTRDVVESASLNAEAQHEAIDLTKADLLVRTDAAYLAVLRTRALLTVARETVKARQDVADQVSALFQSKLKSSLDVSFANVNLADAKLLLSTAENDVRSAEAELARFVALPPDTRFDLADPHATDAPPADSGALVQQALQKRPDLARRKLEAQSSQKLAEAERLLSRPTVDLLGAAGYVPAGEAQIPGRYGAVGLNVNIPVFNGGLLRARQFEAESRSAEQQKAVQDLMLQIQRDVRVAWLNATNAYEKLGLTQQLLNEAKLALDLAQTRYNLGLSSIVELSQSQLQYTSAEIARARAQYDYAAQLSILNFQTGLIP
ncbi:MAG: TolC family protein [Acidobacteriaceae bacterium]|nr:TolC family protein [Acidobacteriaceae bacterium]